MDLSTEQIVNHTLSGIAFYHRDTNLSAEFIQQYQIGHVLQHPKPLLVSDQFGGLSTTTRFVIASAHAAVVESNFTIEAESYFKILDILLINQRTQILLLQLPEAAIEIFTTQRIPFEDKLLETHRQIFIEHTYQPTVAALQTPDWLRQTAAPIGLDKAGKPYYDYAPPPPKQPLNRKVNQYKAGADPDAPPKKSFWQKLFG